MRTHFAYPLSHHRKIVKLVNKKWSLFFFFQDFVLTPTQFLYEIRGNFLFAFWNTILLEGLLVSCFLAKAVGLLYKWAFVYIPNSVI